MANQHRVEEKVRDIHESCNREYAITLDEMHRLQRLVLPHEHPDDYRPVLIDFLRHLVDQHGVPETRQLWHQERGGFEVLHRQLEIADEVRDLVLASWHGPFYHPR